MTLFVQLETTRYFDVLIRSTRHCLDFQATDFVLTGLGFLARLERVLAGLGSVVCQRGTGLLMSTISKRNQKRSDIEAYYRNESKTF